MGLLCKRGCMGSPQMALHWSAWSDAALRGSRLLFAFLFDPIQGVQGRIADIVRLVVQSRLQPGDRFSRRRADLSERLRGVQADDIHLVFQGLGERRHGGLSSWADPTENASRFRPK